MRSEEEQSKKHRLQKLIMFKKRITKKTSIVLAILFKTQYACLYPDPEQCPKYNSNCKICMDADIKCGYRKKI